MYIIYIITSMDMCTGMSMTRVSTYAIKESTGMCAAMRVGMRADMFVDICKDVNERVYRHASLTEAGGQPHRR